MPELNVTSSMLTAGGLSQVAGSSWGGTVLYLGMFVFIPLALLFIGIAVLWNLANYTRFKKYLGWLANSAGYALLGGVTCVVISIPCAFLYYMFNQAKAGNSVPLWWTLIIIGIYAALALIGWFVQKKIIDRVMKFEKQINKSKKKMKINSEWRAY